MIETPLRPRRSPRYAAARAILSAAVFAAAFAAPLAGPRFARAEAIARSSAPFPYEHRENVVYDPDVDGVALVMDIGVPKEKHNGLAIVAVASGSWSSDRGKVRMLQDGGFFDIAAERGYTVFAVRPGSVSKFTGQEMERNVKRGIRWVKAHAAEFNIDPNRIGLSGASAGGHLASLVGLTPDDGNPDAKDPVERENCRVKAVGVFFPPTDFVNWPMAKVLAKGKMKGLFFQRDEDVGATDEATTELMRKISPVYFVTPEAPPFLIFHGTKDPLVPQLQSEMLLKALQDKNVEAKLIYKEGGGHPWPTIREEVAVLADWFDAHLDPKAAPAAGPAAAAGAGK